MTRKAYRVTIKGWTSFELIKAGNTHGQAKARGYIDARDAGLDIPFVSFRAQRAPEFDAEAAGTEGKFPWTLGWSADGVALVKRG